MYLLQDMRESDIKRLHFDDFSEAELYAVNAMDEIKTQLKNQAWTRADLVTGSFSYCERPAIGSPRVYMRLFTDSIEIKKACEDCDRTATFETRDGYKCDAHYQQYKDWVSS